MQRCMQPPSHFLCTALASHAGPSLAPYMASPSPYCLLPPGAAASTQGVPCGRLVVGMRLGLSSPPCPCSGYTGHRLTRRALYSLAPLSRARRHGRRMLHALVELRARPLCGGGRHHRPLIVQPVRGRLAIARNLAAARHRRPRRRRRVSVVAAPTLAGVRALEEASVGSRRADARLQRLAAAQAPARAVELAAARRRELPRRRAVDARVVVEAAALAVLAQAVPMAAARAAAQAACMAAPPRVAMAHRAALGALRAAGGRWRRWRVRSKASGGRHGRQRPSIHRQPVHLYRPALSLAPITRSGRFAGQACRRRCRAV